MSRRSKILLIIGGVVFLATIAIYSIIHPGVFPSTVLGLCFLLYAEIVFFGGLALIDFCSRKSSGLLLWSGAGIPIGIYAVVVFLSSLVFISTQTIVIQGFLVLQIVLLVIAAAICLIIGSFSNGVKKRDEKELEAGRTVQHAIDRLMLIREQTDKKADVDRLIDGLRFSDTSVTVDADAELGDAIAALQSPAAEKETGEDEFARALQGIEFLIKRRNLQTRVSKQGGI